MVKIEFEISDEAYDLLLKINEHGYAEYRDRYDTSSDFLESDIFKSGMRDLDWFLSRNFNGTQKYAWELCTHNLIDTDDMAYHTTFILTDFGKETISKHKIRERTLNEILKNE